MLMQLEQLIGLRVQTQSGDDIGKVEGLVLQTDGQQIHQYKIKPYGLVRLFDTDLLVHRDQVLQITEEEMTVEDSVVAKNKEKEVLKKAPLSTEPITFSRE